MTDVEINSVARLLAVRIGKKLNKKEVSNRLIDLFYAYLSNKEQYKTVNINGHFSLKTKLDDTGDFIILVIDDSVTKIAGAVTLENWPSFSRVRSPFKTPHSMFDPAYAGKGLATLVYTWLLKSGLCLISGEFQTQGANRLWAKLASNWPWFLIKQEASSYSYLGQEVSKGVALSRKSRIVLLGKGWTLDKFKAKAKIK